MNRPTDTQSQWAIAIDADGSVSGLAIAPDTAGGVTVAGSFEGKLTVADTSLSSAGNSDAFVARLGANGTPKWALSFGGKSNDRAVSVAVSTSGMTYVTGEFSGTALFAGENRSSVGAADGFVAAIDENGVLRWVVQLSGPAYVAPTQVAASPAEDAVVAGYFSGSLSFADSVLSSAGALDSFVLVVDKDGREIWARRSGGLGADTARALDIAPSGEIAVGGTFTESADFLGLPLTSKSGDVDGYVAVLSPAGRPVWARGFGGAGSDSIHSLSFAENGNLYAAGSFSDTIDFGAQHPLTTAGDHDAFVAQLSLSGDGLWATRLGGAGTDRANRVAAGDEVVVVAGTFEQKASLGDNSVEARGRHDVFVGKLSSRGVPMWLRGIGGGEEDSVGDLTVASDQRVGVVGSFVIDATVDGTPLKAKSNAAAFVAKLAP